MEAVSKDYMMTLFICMSHAGIASSEISATPQQVNHNRFSLSLDIYDKELSTQDLAAIRRDGM